MQIHQLIHKAQAAKDAGDESTAADELLKLHRMIPDDPGFMKDYAFAANGAGRTKEALDALLAFADRMDKRNGLGSIASGALALELALPYAETLAREAAGLSAYSATDVDEQEFTLSAALRTRFEAKVGETDSHLSRARVAFLRRSWRETEACLDKAGRGTLDGRQGAARFAGPWFDGVGEALSDWQVQLPKFFHRPPHACRVFVACDPTFYRQYGEFLTRTVRGCSVHLHIYNPDTPGVPFGESTEICADADKYYFAAARLIRLHQLMEADPRPTIMLDADLLMRRPLTELFQRLQGADIALCRMPGRLQFHTQFNASVVGINPTPKGMEYLRRVAGYIAKSMAEGLTKVWCLDQISLLCTLREMQSRDAGPKAIAVGPGVYDGTYDADLVPQKVTQFSPHFAQYEAMMERLRA